MCSISGIVSPDKDNRSKVKDLIKIQAHRAPDESGVYKNDFLALGMGRLKIIDLKSKNMTPFQDKNFVLIYNGEIYNYLELKKELKSLGVNFLTNSDTEVLFEAWKKWGEASLSKLNGMFSFCIFDKIKNKLFLARDIAGEKPLYFYKKNKDFFFSSEAKALKLLVKTKVKKNQFFKSFQYCLDETIWENIYQIKPANFAIYDLSTNKLEIKEYWKFKKRKIYKKDILEEINFLISDSIKLRNRSDVKIGLFYSKGLDSSLLRSFSNYNKYFYFDDSKNYLSDFNKKIKKIAYHLDFPVGSLSSYPLFELAKQAKSKGIKVIISGEGADEIFGGYARYMPIANNYYLERNFPSYKKMFRKLYKDWPTEYSKLISRDKNYIFVRNKIKEIFDDFEDPINAMGFVDFKFIMPSLLQMGDRMSSAHGIENRCPFLDKRIIEFGFSLDPEYKIFNFQQKKIIYETFRRKNSGLNIEDEKKGLSFNYNHWFNDKDQTRKKYFELLNYSWKKNCN